MASGGMRARLVGRAWYGRTRTRTRASEGGCRCRCRCRWQDSILAKSRMSEKKCKPSFLRLRLKDLYTSTRLTDGSLATDSLLLLSSLSVSRLRGSPCARSSISLSPASKKRRLAVSTPTPSTVAVSYQRSGIGTHK